MASPTRYTLSYSFDDFQSASPTTPLPADKLEIELSNIQLTTDEIIDNLNLIQRTDGALANGSVSFDALNNTVKALLGSSINPVGEWVTATAYDRLDLVTQSGSTYLAVSDHTSGTFTTDLANEKWVLWAADTNVSVNNSNWSGTDLAVVNGGTGVSTLTGMVKGNGTSAFSAAVQGTDYYAPGGTDVAIADGGTGASTASGARTALGLLALATKDTVNNDDWSGADLSVANGGTGASTAAGARTALDVYSKGETDALTSSIDSFPIRTRALINQTGTQSIIASTNVASIVDTGTGRTRINFTVPYANANYNVMALPSSDSSGHRTVAIWSNDGGVTLEKTTTYVELESFYGHSAPQDSPLLDVIIFGELAP